MTTGGVFNIEICVIYTMSTYMGNTRQYFTPLIVTVKWWQTLTSSKATERYFICEHTQTKTEVLQRF